jgi:hypothetical protein
MKKISVLVCLLAQSLQAQWIQTNGPFYAYSFCVSGTNLFVGSLMYGVFLSTNNGTSWTAVNDGLTSTSITALAARGQNLFAGNQSGDIFLSTNNGTNWAAVSTGLTNTYVYTLAISDTNLFAGTDSGMFLSTNNGTTWTRVWRTNAHFHAFAVRGTNLFAGTSSGVFLSTNNGTNWTMAGLTDTIVSSLAVSNTNLFAGTTWTGGRVFLSTNNGTSLATESNGLPNDNVNSLIVYATNLFAGLEGDPVFRRPLSEMLTSVGKFSTDLPTRFSLQQNYPNPFNPSTTIRYALPAQSRVRLQIFNALGQVVADLVRTEQAAGWNEVTWNANVSSGLYFYKLEAISANDPSKRFVDVKKMLLLK